MISLHDILCVASSCDPDLQSVFAIFTPDTNIKCQPHLLKANSEMEAREWVSYIVEAREWVSYIIVEAREWVSYIIVEAREWVSYVVEARE